MRLKFYALINGGEGPDVWERELCFEADDIQHALRIATSWTERHGGGVVELAQSDRDKQTVVAYRTKDHPEANGKKPSPGAVAYAMEFPLEDGRSLALHMGGKCFEVLSNHLIDMMSQAPSHNDGSCRTM